MASYTREYTDEIDRRYMMSVANSQGYRTLHDDFVFSPALSEEGVLYEAWAHGVLTFTNDEQAIAPQQPDWVGMYRAAMTDADRQRVMAQRLGLVIRT